MPAWGQQPHQIGSLALNQGGGSAGPQLVAILKPRDTTWIVPRTSKYTFYVWGAGGIPATVGAGGGGFARRTISLTKDTLLTCAISFGGVYAPNGSQNTVSATTLSGGGVSITCNAGNNATGGAATGGDLNVAGGTGNVSINFGAAAGGDGTAIGSGGLGGGNAQPGGHPGGGAGNGGNGIAFSGSGEIRIVDETP